MILKGYLFSCLYFGLIPCISFILNKVFKVKTVIIRKSTHIMLSFLWFIMYYHFGTSIHMLIPPLAFFLLSVFAYKLKLYSLFLSSGNFLGIVYYFLSMFILALITYFFPSFYMAYGIGILCMGLADGFAPLVAGFLKSRKLVKEKTITGTLTVFTMAMVVVISFNYIFSTNFNVLEIFIIGIVTAVLELFGDNGLDNIYLPVGVALITYFLGWLTCI